LIKLVGKLVLRIDLLRVGVPMLMLLALLILVAAKVVLRIVFLRIGFHGVK